MRATKLEIRPGFVSRRNARVKARRNNHGEAQDNFQQAIKIERELIVDRPEEDVFLKNLQEHLKNLGDIQVRLGARADALRIFEERLAVSRQRLRVQSTRLVRTPRNPQLRSEVHQLQSGVSVALDRVGQLIRDAGDPKSLDRIRGSVRIDRELFKLIPTEGPGRTTLSRLPASAILIRQLGRQREAFSRLKRRSPCSARSSRTPMRPHRCRVWPRCCRSRATSRRLKKFPAAIPHSEEVELRRRLLARQETNLIARRDSASACRPSWKRNGWPSLRHCAR